MKLRKLKHYRIKLNEKLNLKNNSLKSLENKICEVFIDNVTLLIQLERYNQYVKI